MNYRDQVAVVTGASSGLGRRLALDLAAAGATVVGVARREDRLRSLGIKVINYSTDDPWNPAQRAHWFLP